MRMLVVCCFTPYYKGRDLKESLLCMKRKKNLLKIIRKLNM